MSSSNRLVQEVLLAQRAPSQPAIRKFIKPINSVEKRFLQVGNCFLLRVTGRIDTQVENACLESTFLLRNDSSKWSDDLVGFGIASAVTQNRPLMVT
jgi:hypothetical protein